MVNSKASIWMCFWFVSSLCLAEFDCADPEKWNPTDCSPYTADASFDVILQAIADGETVSCYCCYGASALSQNYSLYDPPNQTYDCTESTVGGPCVGNIFIGAPPGYVTHQGTLKFQSDGWCNDPYPSPDPID